MVLRVRWSGWVRWVVALSMPVFLLACVQGQGPRPNDGVAVDGGGSAFRGLVPAAQLEAAAAKQFSQLKAQANSQGALLPPDHPQARRVAAITQKLLPHVEAWNPQSKAWRWEAVVLKSDQINAFCMPGGKMAVYTGIIEKLKLTDDELAMIMGHEMAHALREHSREQMGKATATELGATVLSAVLGLGQAGDQLLGMGSQLLSLKFSRSDETDADLVGLDIAARAGYDPRAAVVLWQKMQKAGGGGQLEFMSTHPSGTTRIQTIEEALPQVLPLYARATGRTTSQLPPDPRR